jgi:hypothetical protein
MPVLVTGIHVVAEPERGAWMPTDLVRGLKAHGTSTGMTIVDCIDDASLSRFLLSGAEPDSRGLVPATHESDEVIVKIIPLRICRENEPYLPGAWPILHVSLKPDRRGDIRTWLGIDEPPQAVAFRKPLDQALAMFPHAMPDMGGNAGVERTVRSAGHYVDPGAFHFTMLSWMAGTKPGHDGNAAATGATTSGRLTISRLCSRKS